MNRDLVLIVLFVSFLSIISLFAEKNTLETINSSPINNNYKLFEEEFIINALIENHINIISTFNAFRNDMIEENIYMYPAAITWYIHSLFVLGYYDSIQKELEKWEKLPDFLVYEEIVTTANCLLNLKLNNTKDVSNFNETIIPIILNIDKNTTNEYEYVFIWAIEIESILFGKADKCLKILEDDNFEFFLPIEREFLKSKIYASTNINHSIKLMENSFSDFYKNEFQSDWNKVVNNLERKRLFLAFLYYKEKDVEKALENFELALSKDEGSTYIGHTDRWLRNQDYINDEYETLLEIKEIYFSKKVEAKK